MGLGKFEMYHGAVLTQVVRNPKFSLKLITRDERKHSWGMYEVASGNKDYILFIKNTSKVKKGRAHQYSNFTFSIEDIHLLKGHIGQDKNVLVALVCGDEHICLLDERDLRALRILESNQQCGVKVYWQKGTELGVKSRGIELPYRIPRRRLKDFKWEDSGPYYTPVTQYTSTSSVV